MEVNIQDTFGAAFIGGMVAAIMYGITTLQTYLYYVYYPRDSKSMKFLVALICFGNENALNTAVWSLIGSIALNLCIAVLVQTYFAFRIYRLSRPSIRWWLTGSIMLVIIAHFAFGMETVVLMFGNTAFDTLQQFTLIASTPFAITNVLSDICVAVPLCVLLRGKRSPITGTKVLINTLIVYAINRCLLTSVVSVAEVITFAISPTSLWFIGIDFVIGKLYANSFLASLNSRSSLRERGIHNRNGTTSVSINAINLSDLVPSSEGNSGASTQDKKSNVSGGARVKTIPDDDLGLPEMGNFGRGEV
ncbi:hypothetical protein K503DRAFT_281959 [Rhizopogon vinicolor AM-OR11-026]|uniref:DUF6534 domain-containing protein n=1 Tax=Rhizopogon vinicolor AM-OR11-026 TaxID=1314800 RepID=A0A1B7MVS4_9AGAM|nr:hypothetical protein K503DRAFT_281959 [Rhizopogon vinicolor AM-OR11-026]